MNELNSSVDIFNPFMLSSGEKTKLNSSVETLFLEINLPNLLSVEELSKILYSLYNHLFYFFDYLDYQIKFENFPANLDEEFLREYLNFIYLSPFLYKRKNSEMFKQWKLLEINIFKDNVLYLPKVDEKDTSELRSDVMNLKKILKIFGLEKILLTSQQLKKKIPKKETLLDKEEIKENLVAKKEVKPLTPEIKESWKNRELFELGIHTKFSTLDGVSSPNEYIKNAKEKGYRALGITDHYNVQSFPEFWQARDPQLKLVYGCEMEMLEDEFPNFIFNHNLQFSSLLKQKIEDLTYCIFDLETTGFFSEYNEIIEIGYVIIKNGKIIEDKAYLVCPEKEISSEVFSSWYTDIDPKKLRKEKKIKQVLPLIRQAWKNCILIAHNAKKFDFGFLNKAWEKTFKESLKYLVIDTLPLSWIVFPEKKYFSLEKLSRASKKEKVKQTHRALEDSKLLADLFLKIMKILKEKDINYWEEVNKLINYQHFPNRGHKVKILAKNQAGLNNLYNLITLSHTKNLFRVPSVFRSEIAENRKNLWIGAAGNREGEIFSLFSAFNSPSDRKKALRFYDYIELNSLSTFRHFWLNGRLSKKDLENTFLNIIAIAKSLNIPVIAGHHVHYCNSEQKIIKQILVANEGMNGVKHRLYNEATLDEKEDRFANLPEQHLRTHKEIIEDWEFLNDADLVEEIIFNNPRFIVENNENIIIFTEEVQYPDFSENESKLVEIYKNKAQKMFGKDLPDLVKLRIEKEWKIIKENYLSIYWLAYQIVKKTHEDGFIVGSRGSVGSSFIAYLLDITDLNPLPPYHFCHNCYYFQPYQNQQKVFSCFDLNEDIICPECKKNNLKLEGHDLPFETFFGLKGEKIPDIDLNFSGEYQKVAHDFIRNLLGEKFVYRIGTINKLSQQTAEIFLREYKKLKKKFNPRFNIYNNNGDDEKYTEQLKGIKRTTGQHPGGLLIVPQKMDIHDYTPLNFPADNKNSEWKTTHFEYRSLAKIFLKLDVLGHDEPTVLQKLYQLTNVNPIDIPFDDPQVMKMFTEANTLGVPEFGTEFVQKNMLKSLKPTKFSQLVQISGFSHGTNVWTQNQQLFYKEGMKLEELIACREDILTFLTSWGADKKSAFLASEYIRKGKWAILDKKIKNLICEKLQLTEDFVNENIENIKSEQDKLINNISQEITKLEPDKLIKSIRELNKYLKKNY